MHLKLFTVCTLACALLAWCAVGLAAPGNAPDSPPGRQVRDLGKASIQAASAGVPVWNDHAHVTAGPLNRGEITPPSPIFPGRFAVARFKGKDLSWVGYDTLVLDVRAAGEGQLGILLSEFDGDAREDFMLLVESLSPGASTLRFDLKPVPEGDLKLSSMNGDGVWNPDDERGVKMILADYPKGFVVQGMRLEMSEISEGATK